MYCFANRINLGLALAAACGWASESCHSDSPSVRFSFLFLLHSSGCPLRGAKWLPGHSKRVICHKSPSKSFIESHWSDRLKPGSHAPALRGVGVRRNATHRLRVGRRWLSRGNLWQVIRKLMMWLAKNKCLIQHCYRH